MILGRRRLDDAERRAEEAERRAAAAESEGRRHATRARVLEQVLDVLPVAVAVRHISGELTTNAPAARMAASRGPEVLVWRMVEELLAEAPPCTPQARTVELHGPPPRTLVVSAASVGEADACVALIEDVTERRHLDAVRRDFVANVSHELRTPIGALIVLGEAAAGEDDPEVLRRLAARVSTEATRLGRMVDDLLDLSRIEAAADAGREPVHVAELVQAAVERVQRVAEQRRVAVLVRPVDPGLAVPGVRDQLVSAVANLVDNAVKYSDAGAHVDVAVRLEPPWVEIAVRDEGIGIPAKDLGRVFERFFRVDRARSRATGGAGLGLAIVRHVASNHGGDVSVESREGEGSVFTLRLPSGPAA